MRPCTNILPLLLFLIIFSISTPTYAAENITFISDRYKFTFDYPSDCKLKRYGDGYFDIVKDGEILLRGSVEDDVFKIFMRESKSTSDIFRSFARERVKVVCGADGPDGSVFCDEIEGEREFISENGLRVLEFHLIMTQENYSNHTKEKSTFGPVYIVDVSRIDHPLALMFSPCGGVLASTLTKRMVVGIIETVKVVE